MRTFTLSLTLSIGVALVGCAPLVPIASTLDSAQVRSLPGQGDLVLSLRMGGAWTLQDVAPSVKADVKRLEIAPLLKEGDTYVPLSKTGGTTTEGSDDQLKLVFSGDDALLERQFTLKNLAYDRTYRIRVQAFDAQGALISMDAQSYADVLFNRSRWDSHVEVPLQLKHVIVGMTSAAQVTFEGPTGSTHDVRFSLVKVSGESETAIPGATLTVALADLPRKIDLGNLHRESTYRLKAQARRADGKVLATRMLEWQTPSTGQSVAAQSLALQLDLNAVTRYAGTGLDGVADGPRLEATFKQPHDVIRDAQGNLYVADRSGNRIRKIDPAGNVTTWVGDGDSHNVAGNGTAAGVHFPVGMVFDKAGNMFVLSNGGHRILKITPEGDVTLFAGSGVSGHLDASGTTARFSFPSGIAIDPDDNLYVADTGNDRIRKITPAGLVTTYAGSMEGSADGHRSEATFKNPAALAFDDDGNLYVSDGGNYKIRKITPEGMVETFAGTGDPVGAGVDGPRLSTAMNEAYALAFTSGGTLYFTEAHAVRKITPDGTIQTVAGQYSQIGLVDGIGSEARFLVPRGIRAMPDDTLFVADYGNRAVRRLAYP